MSAPGNATRMMWVSHLGGDARHAWRTIVGMPLVSGVIVLSLAVGIGVNTVVFSWIQAVVLRPLPGVPGGSAFFLVEPLAEAGSHPGAAWPEYRDLARDLGSFQDLLAYRMVPFSVGETGRTERAYGLLVSGNYFAALGLRPALGRFLRPDEVTRAGAEPVAVLSYGFWQTQFKGKPDALGRTVRVNGHDLTVIGVVPPEFQGTVLGLQFDLWVPATMAPVVLNGSRELDERSLRGYSMMGRLRPHVSTAQARAELDAAMYQLAQAHPQTNAGVTAEVLPFWRAPRGPQRLIASGLAVLQGLMLLLLLAVCGNTANLVLARAATRQREIGVRLTLGAGTWRVTRLLLMENLLLAVLGASLGAVIAMWGTNAIRAVPLATSFPIRFQTSVDIAGLAFAMILGIVSALMFGLAPAMQLARLDVPRALGAGAPASGRSRIGRALMAIEVALALVVLIVAGLFFRSFQGMRDTNPGFQREGVLLAAYDLTGRNDDEASLREFASRLLQRLRALPAVEAVSIAAAVPLDIHGLPLRSFVLEGRVRTDSLSPDQALSNTVTPGYFQTMGIPIIAGTDFVSLDDPASPPQAIVNEEFVRRYVARGEALGRRIDVRGRSYIIAGTVRNSLYESFGEQPTPSMYFSYRDRPATLGEIHVRTRIGGEMLLAPEVRRIVRELDPTLPVFNVRTLTEHVETNLFFRRIPARMFVVLGPLLLVLAAIGIYAVVACTVARRTTEIGVRLALGATAGVVVRQIVRETLRPVSAGALTGWLIVFVVYTHLVRGGTIDLPVFFGIPAALLFVATVACWLPAHRASHVDPVESLRPSE